MLPNLYFVIPVTTGNLKDKHMNPHRTARSVNVFAALVASAALLMGASAPASASTGVSFDFMGGYSLFISLSSIVILPPSG